MPSVRIAVLASGHGSNLQALLDAFVGPDRPAEVALVLSNRADAGALGRARRAGVPTAVLDPADAGAILAALRGRGVGLVVLAGYLKRVPDAVVAAFRDAIINIHPALLPAFGGPGMYGRRVHEAVLGSGARLTGATVHVVDEQYDHGRILAQWPVPVRPGDTAEKLAARVLEVEHRLLVAAIRALVARGGGAGGAGGGGGGGGLTPLSLRAGCFAASDTLPERLDHALTTA